MRKENKAASTNASRRETAESTTSGTSSTKATAKAMGNSKLTPAEIRDVRTLISILREIVGEDVMVIAAIVSEEAELAMGSTDLPTVRQLAHELIDIAEKALAALEREEKPK